MSRESSELSEVHFHCLFANMVLMWSKLQYEDDRIENIDINANTNANANANANTNANANVKVDPMQSRYQSQIPGIPINP